MVHVLVSSAQGNARGHSVPFTAELKVVPEGIQYLIAFALLVVPVGIQYHGACN